MEIVRMNHLSNDSGSKTSAYFDIKTDDGIIIKGFKLVNGANGMFMSSPNDKGKDGKYYDSVILPKEMKQNLEKMALTEFKDSKD